MTSADSAPSTATSTSLSDELQVPATDLRAQGEFVLGNLSEKSTIAVFIEAHPIKGLCREQIHPASAPGDLALFLASLL